MVELGQWLRNARETKGLSLAQVEDAIRIRQKYLAALESGDWTDMPGDVAARGFLRNYSAFLGLDQTEALSRLSPPSTDATLIATSAQAMLGPRAVDYRPIELDLIEETPLNVRWLTIGLLVGAVVIAFVVIFFATRSNPRLLAGLTRPTATPTLAPTLTPERVGSVGGSTQTVPPTVTPTDTVAPFRITATPTSGIFTLPTPTPTATPLSTAQPTATATSLPSQLDVTADVSQRAWIRVTADGAIVFEKILEAGATQTWSAGQTLVLRTGNAGGVSVTVNGKTQGTMGDLGGIEECTWTLDTGSVQTNCTTNPGTSSGAPTGTPGAST